MQGPRDNRDPKLTLRPGGRPGGPGGSGSKDQNRINESIRVPQVRLIDENGEMLGVYATSDAIRMAKDRGLDLLEVSPTAVPPVCKIVDYGKFKYEKKKKGQEAKKKQAVIQIKEVQLRPQIEDHDLEYKTNNIRRFLQDGDKAKVTVMFRGREIAYVDHGHKLLARLMEQVKDVGTVEAPPKLEGKRLTLILAPLATAAKPAAGKGDGKGESRSEKVSKGEAEDKA